MPIDTSDPRFITGCDLIAAAHRFWTACNKTGQHGAVQWLEGSEGELLIFTRGEYRQTLMANIERLPSQPEVQIFGESLRLDDD